MIRLRLMVACLVAACGCKSHTDAEDLNAGRTAVGEAAVATAPAAAASGRPGAHPTAWRGVYKSAAGALYIPPDWKDVHWRVKESSAGVGEGTIAIQVDRASGRVLGTLEGPLGPANIDGYASDGRLTATVARKDPADKGFTGTIVGTLADRGVEGTMNLSLAEASAIRTATFTTSGFDRAAARAADAPSGFDRAAARAADAPSGFDRAAAGAADAPSPDGSPVSGR